VRSNGGWTAQTELGGKRQRFYGGKLCENLVQAVARDVFAEALLRLERAGFEVVFHVHDEAVCEVATQNAPEAARAIAALLTTTPDWMPGLPLEAETQISPSYFK
jgi:DNA polymerase